MGAKLASLSGVLGATQDRGLSLITSSTFSAASTVSVDGCFSSSFDNYRVVITNTAASADVQMYLRLRLSGADATGANYFGAQHVLTWTATHTYQENVQNATAQAIAYGSASLVLAMDVRLPASAVQTTWAGTFTHDNYTAHFGGRHAVATAYDGLTIYTASGTISGTISVFGYRLT
jgi:hypothetical protein